MPKYNVFVPVAGYVGAEIEADTKEDAINEALSKGCIFRVDDPDFVLEDIDFYPEIVSGNVYHCPLNKAYAEEMDDD